MKNLIVNYYVWEQSHLKNYIVAHHFVRKRLRDVLFFKFFVLKIILKLVRSILILLFFSSSRMVRMVDASQGIYEEL